MLSIISIENVPRTNTGLNNNVSEISPVHVSSSKRNGRFSHLRQETETEWEWLNKLFICKNKGHLSFCKKALLRVKSCWNMRKTIAPTSNMQKKWAMKYKSTRKSMNYFICFTDQCKTGSPQYPWPVNWVLNHNSRTFSLITRGFCPFLKAKGHKNAKTMVPCYSRLWYSLDIIGT